MRDHDIRSVLTERLEICCQADQDTILVEELGLRGGTVRADVAVINGCIKGFEIKSDRDTLKRLARQSEIYSRVFDTMTLVVGECHLKSALSVVPDWWGIETAVTGDHDGIPKLIQLRAEAPNKGVDPLDLVQLLWRDEVLELLSKKASSVNYAKSSRKVLWKALADSMSLQNLKDIVRDCLKKRSGWRAVSGKTLDGVMSRPYAMLSNCPSPLAHSRIRRYIHHPN
jgi:phosphoribosyl-AMP cyclohydrolase